MAFCIQDLEEEKKKLAKIIRNIETINGQGILYPGSQAPAKNNSKKELDKSLDTEFQSFDEDDEEEEKNCLSRTQAELKAGEHLHLQKGGVIKQDIKEIFSSGSLLKVENIMAKFQIEDIKIVNFFYMIFLCE